MITSRLIGAVVKSDQIRSDQIRVKVKVKVKVKGKIKVKVKVKVKAKSKSKAKAKAKQELGIAGCPFWNTEVQFF